MTINTQQELASDPQYSCWVSASAGTGKTKILSDRVLKLLLSGVDATKILCITYTKAAANEMHVRINEELLAWSKLNNTELENHIKKSLNITFSISNTKINPKNLYQKLLEEDKQVEIMTIHSLCQSILKNFSLEAGINPDFKILDDASYQNICSKIINNLNYKEHDKETKDIIDFFSNLESDYSFSELIKNILNDANKIKELLYLTNDKIPSQLNNSFNSLNVNISDNHTLNFNELNSNFKKNNKVNSNYVKINETSVDEINISINNSLKELFEYSNKELSLISDNEIIEFKIYQKLKENINDNVKDYNKFYDNLKKIFLNKDFTYKKKLYSKSELDKFPIFCELIDRISHKLYGSHEYIVSKKLAINSFMFKKLSMLVCENFFNLIKAGNFLTYDMLISKTKDLLTKNDLRDWILFKLDGGIFHLLLDEAQDTSPEQWSIVKALVSEFFSGNTSYNVKRTLFVVGDDKQSIYSFQGARAEYYNNIQNFFSNQVDILGNKFLKVKLDRSYRSLKNILLSIDEIFKYIIINYPDIKLDYVNLINERKEREGEVKIFPLITNENNCEEYFWPIFNENNINEEITLQEKTAHIIARYIYNRINDKNIENRSSPSDFMILVRKRDEFIYKLSEILDKLNIKSSGIDRINILENQSVIDLLSLGNFIILKDDDLNLISLLKSSFFNLSELDINIISQNANLNKISIWEYLSKLGILENNNNAEILKNLDNKNIMDKIDIKEIYFILKSFLSLYKKYGLKDFFHIIIFNLDYLDNLCSNNIENKEAIEEFLYQVESHVNYSNNNIFDFIQKIQNINFNIKRDPDLSNSVRLSTVHGSKGLQSKIVIIADSCKLPTESNSYFFTDEDIIYPGTKENHNNYINSIIENNKKLTYREYIRLLYVALTRAEDELIIIGYNKSEKINKDCWYSIIKNALNYKEENIDYLFEQLNILPKNNHDSINKIQTSKSNNYLVNISKYININKINDDINIDNKEDINSNDILIDLNEESKFGLEYGTIFHQVMEYMIKNKINSISQENPILNRLPKNLKLSINEKLKLLINNSYYLDLINTYTVKTESSIGIIINEEFKLGRIDLIGFKEDNIIIIDYKTDSNTCNNVKDLKQEYKEQLQFYKYSIQKLYPNLNITTKILWLHNMSFLTVI